MFNLRGGEKKHVNTVWKYASYFFFLFTIKAVHEISHKSRTHRGHHIDIQQRRDDKMSDEKMIVSDIMDGRTVPQIWFAVIHKLINQNILLKNLH